MQRQVAIVREVARRERLRDSTILDFGCGTGWLANELVDHGTVLGTDLSPEAVRVGNERFPAIELRCGDFMDMDLPAPFDLIISSDSLVPMPERAACIAKVAQLQRPGGVFLLMTQNAFVWSRRSTLRAHDAAVPNGRVQQWPGRRRVLRLLEPYYVVEETRTFMPGGDQGLLFWVDNRQIRGLMRRVVGESRWTAFLERVGLGREFVVVARRR